MPPKYTLTARLRVFNDGPKGIVDTVMGSAYPQQLLSDGTTLQVDAHCHLISNIQSVPGDPDMVDVTCHYRFSGQGVVT